MASTSSTRHAINFAWLIRLRWYAVVAQALMVAVADRIGIAVPVAALATVLAVDAASNVGCMVAARSGREVREWWLATVMAFDTLSLTALLSLTGGPFNPFSFLYLVQIALATVVLRESLTWALVLLSMAGSALLFVHNRPLPLGAGTHADHMAFHLRGMWVAFTVAAASIVYFLLRITRALAEREADLARAREQAARHEKLVSLATLAAGAAHELATPLSTIAVVARELERTVSRPEAAGDRSVLDDVQLIRGQVARCREILDRMAADAGESAGETARMLPVGLLVRDAVAGIGPTPPIVVEMDERVEGTSIELPQRAVTSVVRSLVKNAMQAAGDKPVRVRAVLDADHLRIEVRDEGHGMTPDILARAGEPFFTTKPPGQGMGLGLFLSRALAQRLGGEVSLESHPGGGTTAALVLPVGPNGRDRRGANVLRMGN